MVTEEFVTNVSGAGVPMTRKDALKRITAGAAAAWAVPMFITTAGAGARSTVVQECPTSHCGNPPAHTSCAYFEFFKGDSNTFCGNCGPCTHVQLMPCSNNKQCPSGWKCGETCCASSAGYCIPPCGHEYVHAAPHRGSGTSCH
jgi:hypothetical protein